MKTSHHTRFRFLVSRQSLLDHLDQTEKNLKTSIVKHTVNDEEAQKELLERYTDLIENLELLKQYYTENPSLSDMADQKFVSKKKLTEEFKYILTNFNNFILDTGFLRK